eukprot:scaffold8817_cov124-Amphora_coffeaeformis.AAC.2
MWSGNEECNDEGQPVRLYQPIQYGGSNVRSDDPTASFIGGPASTSRQCPCCKQHLVTLVQLHIPATERALRVEACNSASCFRTLFEWSKFHFGGNGIVACERLVAKKNQGPPTTSVVVESKVETKSIPVDDWGISGDAESGMDDLEAKLAAMEAGGPKEPVAKESKPSSVSKKTDDAQSVLPKMALHSTQEPPARTVSVDPRDVGLYGTSNLKIEQMLARYLEDEEDQDIVQMLKGSGSAGTGGQEPDQDLTEDEMALLKFSDRLKRSPRQVIRYAYGGEPLWSRAPPKQPVKLEKKRGKSPAETNKSQVPPCACGATRVFECQILPSVLHVLNVDKFVKQSGAASSQLNEWYCSGGMDFGSIAIYTCSRPDTCTSSQEFVVIQDTPEDQPKVPMAGLRDAGDVIVDENAANDDQDDGDYMQD